MKKFMLSVVLILFSNFHDGSCAKLSLQEAIEIALSQNTDIIITQKDEETAEAEYRKSKGENSFSVNASSNLDVNKSEGSHHNKTLSNRISGNLPVYTGGKSSATIKSSEIAIKLAELQTARQCENLKLNVIQAYYEAIRARKLIDINQEAVSNYEAHYTNSNQLYHAGSKPKVDVLRASVELSNAKYSLISAQNDYEIKLSILRNYLNIDRNESLELTDDFLYEQFSIPLMDCIDYAYNHRKDLLIDLYNLKQKELAIKIAKAGFLPNVTLSIGTGLTGNNSTSWDMSADISTGVSANWNIFDSGVTRAQIDEAKIERDKAQLNFNKDKENIDLALRESYYNMRRSENQLNSTYDAVQKAEEDYFIAKEKYRVGEGIFLDVLDAQQSLSESRFNHLTAQYDYLKYKAILENTMGIGLTQNEMVATQSIRQNNIEDINLDSVIEKMERLIKISN